MLSILYALFNYYSLSKVGIIKLVSKIEKLRLKKIK